VSADGGGAVAGQPGTIIGARGVVKSFGQTPALRGATVSAAQGEILAVMGPSGSGKSTLLHCLAGILTPDAGEVWFAGNRLDIRSEAERSVLRRDRFGFVFQSGQLVPELTAEENVALPLQWCGTRRGPALAQARAWFGRLGLDGLERRRSGELSGGQAQRVALARGLVARPDIIFADEPTGSLDSVSGGARDEPADRRRPPGRHHGDPGHPRGPGRRLRRPAGHRPRRHGQHAHRRGAMIRLGLRLTVSGGREAAARLVLLVTAIGLGTGLLLTALSGINAVNTQNARYAWLDTAAAHQKPTGRDPLWGMITADGFDGQTITRVDVAATGPTSPVPPGIPKLPGPGQYYVSPALASLLNNTPGDELAARYPGHQAGLIGDAALPSPDSLIIIIGHGAAQLSRVKNAGRVWSINTTPPSSCTGSNCQLTEGTQSRAIDLILAVVTLALLFPVLIFIATATRLSAARREQRFAAMRLTGATPRQISLIAAVAAVVAAVTGTAAGFAIFFALRVPLAAIPFTGQPFFPGDLSLSIPDILLTAFGVPVAAAVAARIALRRVHISRSA
jgi:ABC-type lipoprotein export system ATPase subunit